MVDLTPPPCHRCNGQFDDHGPRGNACSEYVWPGSLKAAALDLDRAVSDLWREVSAPFVRLLGWITRRR